MKASEIAAAILALKDMEDLKVVNEAVAYQWKRVTSATAKKFRVGERVQFTSSKTGRTEKGEIVKVNQKTIQVRTATTTWRVSPSLLKKVA